MSPPRPRSAPAVEGSSSSTSAARRATAEKREWLAAANKLRLAQRQLEAALGANTELGALNESEGFALEAEQEGLVEAMGEHLGGIRTTVTRLTAHVSQPYQGAEFIGTLTRLMDQGESSISELKAAQRTQFDGLLSSESELDKELQLFVERAKGWENATTPSTAAAAPVVVRRPKTAGGVPGVRPARPLKEVWDGRVPDEVTAYDSFVERTGATGSWDAPDHAYFKKALARCCHDYARTTEVLATEMAAVFSRGEVIAHARWDAEHEDLLIRKRMAIQRWRAEKEKLQAEQMQAGLQAVAATTSAYAPRKATAAETSEEREEQRRALEAWRADRKAKAEELERARVEQEAAAAEERRKVRAAKLKESQRQRQATEEEAARQREAAVAELASGQSRPRSAPQFRSRPTAAELAKFKEMHERDLVLAARRTAAVGACKDKSSAKARRLEELRVQRKPSAPAAPRDPKRLLQPTAAVAARMLAEDGPGQLFAERPVHVPRMVPSWMGK